MKTEVLDIARARMGEAYDADRENREHSADDLKFVIGDQWPEAIRAKRDEEGKPCITVNGLAQFVRQVTGQIRAINPAIKVLPADTVASEDVAKIYEGLIRHIEHASDAENVYEAAGESAAQCGIGHWRILAEYGEGATFDQEIKIKRIPNPFAVFWDPHARETTREDAEWCFVVANIPRDEFRETYPKAKEVDVTTDHDPATLVHWATGEYVTVAEYFWKDYETKTIGMLASGQVVENPRPPMDFESKREVRVPVVKWAKMTGAEILEGPKVFPSRFIPVVAVTGEEISIGERLYRSSVIRHAKDSQQLYNFARSAMAEIVALQPKAPYIGTVKQFQGLESLWNAANSVNRPYLPYNPDERAPGAPQRSTPPVASSGWMNEMQIAAEDMKRTTGIYDASLGARSNETTGVAIRQRQAESQIVNSIYADNTAKAVKHTGRIICDMIPRIYDSRRVVRIMNADDEEEMIEVNRVFETIQGAYTMNDMTAGKYDVRIVVGPNFATRKQEAAQGMLQFLQAVPMAGPMVADLVAKSQDWPDAEKFAERLKPQGVTDDEDQRIAMLMQQIQQMQQAMQQMQQAPEMQKTMAEASLKQAQAEKANAEATAAQLQNMATTGQLDAMISQLVRQEVIRALQGAMAPQRAMIPQGM